MRRHIYFRRRLQRVTRASSHERNLLIVPWSIEASLTTYVDSKEDMFFIPLQFFLNTPYRRFLHYLLKLLDILWMIMRQIRLIMYFLIPNKQQEYTLFFLKKNISFYKNLSKPHSPNMFCNFFFTLNIIYFTMNTLLTPDIQTESRYGQLHLINHTFITKGSTRASCHLQEQNLGGEGNIHSSQPPKLYPFDDAFADFKSTHIFCSTKLWENNPMPTIFLNIKLVSINHY